MMSLRLAPPLPLIFLLMIEGASGAEWSVKYNQQKICALKGSTVFMNGSYTHPDSLMVKTFWIIDPVEGVEKPDLSKESDYSGRVEYFTDEQKKHFSLKLSNVEKKDEKKYYFRFITHKDKWLGKPGVQLKVTELRVETPGAVTEGGAAVLKCVTTCSLTAPTFIWYKNGRPLTTKTTINNQLHLQPVSSEDAGSYSCAVKGYQHLPSPDHTLTVRCASGAEWCVKYTQQEICALKGSTVFMNGSYIQKDGLTVTQRFWVHNAELTDMSKKPDYSGRVKYFTDEQKQHFFLQLSNVEKKDEQEYNFKLITHNEKRVDFPGVHLNVTELRVETPGAVTEGGAAVLKCVTTCSLTAPTFIWYKNGYPLTTKATINNQLHLQPVSSEDAGSYSCAVNEYQHLPSPDHTLTVRYRPKNVSVSINSFDEIVEGSSVILTCSSDANPPVENYTWFIEGGVSPVGSGHSYSPLQSGSYYCEARNEHGAQRSAPFLFRAKGSVTVYVVVAVVAGIIAVLLVLVWMRRRKKQKRNTDEGYVNIYVSQRFSEDDTSNPPDYKNLEDNNVHPLDDAGGVPFYED